MSDYLFDKTGADPEVADLEHLLGSYAHRAALRAPPPRRRWPLAVAGLAVAAAAAAALLLVRDPVDGALDCQRPGAGFAFSVSGGPARCGGTVAARGTLPVGAWLETTAGAVADVRIADIGDITLRGEARVRLVDTGAARHHLELARGTIDVRVVAPPRLFVVDTPVATAVDLGCAYQLTVDADGVTHLRVTSGAVSLEGHGRVSYAPAGTEVLAVPGHGPGTPVAITAAPVLRAAIARFDRGDLAAIDTIVAAADLPDAITLWNLLPRTLPAARATVFARLAALSPPPPSVRAADILSADPAALERWREALDGR